VPKLRKPVSVVVLWFFLVIAQWVVIDLEIVGFFSGVLHILNTLNYTWPLVLASLMSILIFGRLRANWQYALLGLLQVLGVVISVSFGLRGNSFTGATGFVMQGLEMFAMLLATTIAILGELNWKLRNYDLRWSFREARQRGYSPGRFFVFAVIVLVSLALGAALFTGPLGDVEYLVTAFRYGALLFPGIFTLVITVVGVWVLAGTAFKRLPRWVAVVGLATASCALVIARELCHIAIMGNNALTIISGDVTVSFPGKTPVSIALSAVSMFVAVIIAAVYRTWTLRKSPTSSTLADHA
jgi:hypothetical protein